MIIKATSIFIIFKELTSTRVPEGVSNQGGLFSLPLLQFETSHMRLPLKQEL